MTTGPAARPVVDRVRVTIASRPPDPKHPVDVVLLDVDLAEPSGAAVTDSVVEALLPVLEAETGGAEIAVCHRYRFGGGRPERGLAEVLVGLGHEERSADDLLAGVAASFRTILDSVRATRPAHLERDAALRTARERVAEAFPEVRSEALSVSAEDHHSGRWSIELVDAALAAFEVTIGVVDGNPATTHVRRLAPLEVVDSVGSA
jgi:hypothetical protein